MKTIGRRPVSWLPQGGLARLAVGLALGLAVSLPTLAGCGGAPQQAQAPESVEPIPAPPKDAAALAKSAVQSRIDTTIRVDRLRDHPLGQRLVGLDQLRTIFEGTGINLLEDASVVFVASTGITQQDKAVVVVRHGRSDDELRSGIEVVMGRSDPPGRWLSETKLPAAQVSVRGREHLLVLADEGFLVMLPSDRVEAVDTFEGPLALTVWEGSEALVADVEEPSKSLRAHGAPPIPPTISRATVRVVLRSDGGADVHGDGQSTTPDQAASDALALTKAVDRATSVKVSFLRVRFFRSVPFRSEQDRVKADLNLSAEEVSKLLSLAEVLGNR